MEKVYEDKDCVECEGSPEELVLPFIILFFTISLALLVILITN